MCGLMSWRATSNTCCSASAFTRRRCRERFSQLRDRVATVFFAPAREEGRFAFDSRRDFLEENGEEFLALNQSLYRLGAELEQLPQKPEEVFTLFASSAAIAGSTPLRDGRARIRTLSSGSSGAAFAERRRRPQAESHPTRKTQVPGAMFFCKPLRSKLADSARVPMVDKLDYAVLTSATLAVGGGFDYMRQRLGLEHARELLVASHFDYESQAIVLCAARSSRSAHAGIPAPGCRARSGSCWRSRADAPSCSSPAMRR